MNEKINLWVFWYNSNTWESSAFPISYHKTKGGAIKAMNTHKKEKRNEHEAMIDRQKKWNIKNGFEESLGLGKFGQHESWSVDEFELEILP